MSRDFDVRRYRTLFPALSRQVGDRAAVFLDGPGGSQVPSRVIEAVARYLSCTNANCGGDFATSVESDALLEGARKAVADLLGTGDPGTVSFGANMTTLTLALARAFSRIWGKDDEVLVTRLDHDANVSPWVQAARDAGARVRHVEIRREDCTLDLADLGSKLGPRTRLLAFGCASNATGTITPIRRIIEMAHEAGALVFLDAVHYAPHALMDVEAWDCDFLACSAYKFFGPHVGILYGKRDLLESLPVYKLRPASDALPHRWETGTLCHEGIAGTTEAIEYLACLGGDQDPAAASRRSALRAAFRAIGDYERSLSLRMLEGLARIRGLRLYGIADSPRLGERTPTFAFTLERRSPREVASLLAARGIFVWSGNFYALPLTEALGVEPDGLVRAGLLHYNTAGEIDTFVEALERIR